MSRVHAAFPEGCQTDRFTAGDDFTARFQRASFQGMLKQLGGKQAEARCGIDWLFNPALKALV
jgi:hypothetical protein